MCTWAITTLWPSFMSPQPLDDASLAGISGGVLGINAIKALFSFNLKISLRIMGLGYLLLFSTTCLICVIVLLYQQCHYIVEGKTYIEIIKSQGGSKWIGTSILQGIMSNRLMYNLRRIFGSVHPLYWLCPRILPPSGSLAESFARKTHKL